MTTEERLAVVWGPSALLLSADPALQEQVGSMQQAGIRVEVCRHCAEDYGVTGALEELGIDVRYMGEPLSTYLKEGRRVLTL